MVFKRIIAIAIALVVALAGSGCSGSVISSTKTLRLAINQTAKHPSTIALVNMGKRLKEASGGKLAIEVYPNETLGAQAEVLQLVKAGIVDMAVISGTQMENLNKDFVVPNLPGMFGSVEQQLFVVNDNPVMYDLYKSLEPTWNITILGGFTQGTRSLYTRSDKEIKTPQDIGGMKIRVQESAMMMAMIQAINGSPTPMAYGEVYTALQSGVLDAAENNEVSYFSVKHFEVAKHYWYTKHLVGLDYVIVNSDLYKSLDSELKPVFDKEWTATYKEHAQLWGKATQDAIDGAKAGGATFHEVDSAAFKQALEPVAEKFTTTDSAKKLHQAMKAAAAEYKGA